MKPWFSYVRGYLSLRQTIEVSLKFTQKEKVKRKRGGDDKKR